MRHRPRHNTDFQDRKQSDSATTASDAASCEEPFNATSAPRPVAKMNKEEMGEIETMFSQTEEVAATLLFSDGSTQLRDVLVCLFVLDMSALVIAVIRVNIYIVSHLFQRET